MVLSAVRGGLAFLTRLPVPTDEGDWAAFAATPLAFPVVGYVVGVLAGVPFLLLAGPPAAFGYLFAVYLLTGVNHADGLADLGDAAAVHGDPAERRSVLTDSSLGVGGALALGVSLVGLSLAALGLAGLPPVAALGLVVAAEVGAKLGMAAVACLGEAAHEGFGSTFTRECEPALLLGPVVATVPALLLALPGSVVAVLGAVAVAVYLTGWATEQLGGVSGDVFGAANELGRIVALHAGLVAWTML